VHPIHHHRTRNIRSHRWVADSVFCTRSVSFFSQCYSVCSIQTKQAKTFVLFETRSTQIEKRKTTSVLHGQHKIHIPNVTRAVWDVQGRRNLNTLSIWTKKQQDHNGFFGERRRLSPDDSLLFSAQTQCQIELFI